MPGVNRRWVELLCLPLLLITLILPVEARYAARGWNDWHFGPVHVTSGQSIQAAIDSAQPGQAVIVEAGTYAEQVTITTSGLKLIGKGASIVPPESPVENTCSGLAGPGTEAGICIQGQDVVLADYVQEHRKVLSVGQAVRGVLVSGFEISGFSGLDVAVVGGQDCKVANNILYDGAQYGCLTVGSENTVVDTNTVAATADMLFIGICMDDLSNVQVTNNDISNYAIGFCVQTNGALIQGNTVTNSCIGAYVDPGVSGVHIIENHISDANPICPSIPDLGSLGVAMIGASDTVVKQNTIEGLTANGVNGAIAVGVIIIDDPATGTPASGNLVVGNVLQNNDFDIFVNTTGTGNVVEGNQCSTPAELCSS
ncbi:hypothetical protein PV08_09057 [Exophiala spinifera]|uniref:Right handed beta helix domain-containing protein n=1 Tax=Exophiala spinifera TaxID=91928 RepID=A0A0D2AZ92_9EURO|nr:uncharacterized protein PV08_09057 [Exophiala spinifera]KIW11785.1 hypothetical protein PV08_09057 [Exophiala spinifera]